MADGYIQAKASQPGGSGTSISLSFDSSVTAGSVLVATVSALAGKTVTWADNNGNTWESTVRTISDPGSGIDHYVSYCKNANAGATTVTATYSGSDSFRGIGIMEIGGTHTTAPLDKETGQYQSNPGTGTDAVTSGAQTTTADGETIVGVCWWANAGGAQTSAGTGFTSRVAAGPVSTLNFRMETKEQASAGSVAATFTLDSASINTVTFMLTFKDAGGGAGTVPLLMQMYSGS